MSGVYTPKLKTQLSVRLPTELAQYIRDYAEKYTGGNVSRALEEILTRCLSSCGP